MTGAIQIQEALPTKCPYALRYRARAAGGEPVECRVMPRNGPPAVEALFVQEFRELAALTHPAFPPVLGQGMFRGRPYLLTPRRELPTLDAWVDAPAGAPADLAARCGMVRSLADAVGHLHLNGLTIRHLEPAAIAWDAAASQVVFLHHRFPPPPGLGGFEGRVPPDCRRAVPPSPRADLYHLGRLAFRLLSGGREPVAEGSERPELLRRHAPGVATDLAYAIDSCLAWNPRLRLENAAELKAMLDLDPTNLAAGSGEGADEAALAARFQDSIAALRAQGVIPSPTELILGKTTFQRLRRNRRYGAAAALAAVLLLPAPLLISRWAASGGGSAEELAPAAPAEPRRWLAPSDQAKFLDDPYLKALLETQRVDRSNFLPVWRRLRGLALRGKLPPGYADIEKVGGLHAAFRDRPEAACAELEALLESLRAALGAG